MCVFFTCLPYLCYSLSLLCVCVCVCVCPPLRVSLSGTFLRRKDVVNQCLVFAPAPAPPPPPTSPLCDESGRGGWCLVSWTWLWCDGLSCLIRECRLPGLLWHFTCCVCVFVDWACYLPWVVRRQVWLWHGRSEQHVYQVKCFVAGWDRTGLKTEVFRGRLKQDRP